jgi:hypothetical protein
MLEIIGATVRSRTADILITSEVLYQLSYGGLGAQSDCKEVISFFIKPVNLFGIGTA